MLYCDYDTYSAMGGTMSAEQYGLWGPRASRKIGELTLGRAEGHAADLETELADACAQMADAMQRLAAAKVAAPGLSSVNVDGYTESYMNPTELARTAYFLTRWDPTATVFCIGGCAEWSAMQISRCITKNMTPPSALMSGRMLSTRG